MYFHPGVFRHEIGDFEVVEKDGQLHVFYLELPSHDSIGHLVSDDGINWKRLPSAIRTGDPGEFDDDQIWTMGVFKHEGLWFMLYTANQNLGRNQVIGLATSPDLLQWTKYKNNPVIAPDPRWYEAVQKGSFRIDWRDPHVIKIGDTLHGFVCARRNHGPLNRRGCAGYFTSRDGYHWTVHRPACTPSNCFDWECPSVFMLQGRYYMVAIAGGPNRMVYRVSDRIEGPYTRLHDDSLLPGNNMSVRPCLWKGKLHLFHWQRNESLGCDWTSSWLGGGGYSMLASPKIAKAQKDGTLLVESFDWSPFFAGKSKPISRKASGRSSSGTWKWSGGSLLGTGHNEAAIWLTSSSYKDFVFCADLKLDLRHPAKEFGLVMRAESTGSEGIFAGYTPGRFTAELIKYVHNRRHGPQSLWRGRKVLQANHMAPSSSGRYRLKIIAFGPSIEFNINSRLVLATMTMPRREGRVGIFLEDGSGIFSNISVQKLQRPKTNWELE